MLKNGTSFNMSKSNLLRIMKMLCLFANTRLSNVIFYDFWPVFKQLSHLSYMTC